MDGERSGEIRISAFAWTGAPGAEQPGAFPVSPRLSFMTGMEGWPNGPFYLRSLRVNERLSI
jgi:hypothetical protein